MEDLEVPFEGAPGTRVASKGLRDGASVASQRGMVCEEQDVMSYALDTTCALSNPWP